MTEIFDDWSEKYDQWFDTPIGKLIRAYEQALIFQMLNPESGERLLDIGCGTGIFTSDMIETGARVVGLELSLIMLRRAQLRFKGQAFQPVQGDMAKLPFGDNAFHKTVSITAIEFVEDAQVAVDEMFRVTKAGGVIVVATLNALSPWANRRRKAAQNGHSIFRHAIFRSPKELIGLSPVEGNVQTAVHFEKNEDPHVAPQIESSGRKRGLDTGAFLAVRWKKPTSLQRWGS